GGCRAGRRRQCRRTPSGWEQRFGAARPPTTWNAPALPANSRSIILAVMEGAAPRRRSRGKRGSSCNTTAELFERRSAALRPRGALPKPACDVHRDWRQTGPRAKAGARWGTPKSLLTTERQLIISRARYGTRQVVV